MKNDRQIHHHHHQQYQTQQRWIAVCNIAKTGSGQRSAARGLPRQAQDGRTRFKTKQKRPLLDIYIARQIIESRGMSVFAHRVAAAGHRLRHLACTKNAWVSLSLFLSAALPVCVSRACLGNTITVFSSIQRLKKGVFFACFRTQGRAVHDVADLIYI
jgi:hypothetical protein